MMDEIREAAALNKRLERIEEALYGAGLFLRPVIVEETSPPLVPVTLIGTPFRGSALRAYDVTASFVCPACGKDNIVTIYTKARGVNVSACAVCKHIVRVDLQW
jgi:hypothetical protein